MSNESYARFFSEVGAYLSKEKERKKIDNDYNPLLVIRSQSDEVKLHSRIIHSLLDTHGKHYQGSLFLEPFLEMLDFKDFALDLHKALVMREYKHIDLYISDNDKHIIIENKINAWDSDRQIERYIDLLINDGVECENIAVVYLSVESQKISPHSLGKWKLDKAHLVCGDKKIRYKNITYSDEILSWVESCQSKAKNITNLYTTLEFYKQCVEKITKGEKMGLEKFLKENRNFIKIATEIKRLEIEEICVNLFKSEVASKAEFSEWDFVNKGVAFGFCPKGYLKQVFKFMLTLEKTPASRYLGFRLHINGKDYPNDLPKRLKAIIEKQGFKLNAWGWWLCDESSKDMVDLTNESLEEYFTRRYKNANKLNELLKNDSEIAKLASEVK